MASYTANQLSGDGTPTEALVGNKTFTLTNPSSGSAYFTIETVRNSDGFYDSTSATNALGDYTNFVSIDVETLVTSSYIASVVVPSGGGSFDFDSTVNIAESGSFLRATDGVSLVIS